MLYLLTKLKVLESLYPLIKVMLIVVIINIIQTCDIQLFIQ